MHGKPRQIFHHCDGIRHSAPSPQAGAGQVIPAPTEQCSCSTCPYMKMNTLEKLYLALRDLSPAVELPEDLRRRAEAPLLRMLEQSQS
ncbi:MAG: quinolinate synthase NadA [Akkermansia sp.]